MPTYTTIPESTLTEQLTDTFGGYNHNYKIGDGEFYDMKNLTSDYYPLMGNRQLRSIIPHEFDTIYGIAADGAGDLYVVGKGDGDTSAKLYEICKGSDKNAYEKIVSVSAHSLGWTVSGSLTLSDGEKQMLFFGNELVIFPDAVAVNIKDALPVGGESEPLFPWRSLGFERSVELSETVPLVITPCDAEGNELSGSASETAPQSPTEGTVWIDTSGGKIVWKKYTASTWIALTDVYAEIAIASTMRDIWDISTGDAVTFGGIGDLSGSHIIIKAGVLESSPDTKRFIINGIVSEKKEIKTGTFTAKREVPKMDFVVQAQNRLWGCRYYEAQNWGEESINEIYACKLGDARNWNVFQGLSTDSYTASCGTMGEFTGAANLNGYPIFFKENCFHKVHISSSGAHQITDKSVQGVQDGCGGSVAMVGDICYYKSRTGIVAFDGTTTYSLGDNLGDVRYTEAVGGSANDKYYISMKDSSGQWSMFAYDTSKALWHKEDESHALQFYSVNSDTFFITQDSSDVYNISLISDYNKTSTQEDAQEWEAVTGLQGYSYTGQKYISRFNLRMVLPKGSYMDIYIEYDSDGRWEHQGHIKGTGTTSFMIPVRPRRCDHFRIKFAGAGDVRLYSMSKLFEGGTDVR